MKTYDIIKFAFGSIGQRKLRSWLTVVGIVIGVAAIVSLISIGEGTQQQITSQLSQLGANVITITPGHARASGGFGAFGSFGGPGTTVANLTEDDVRLIKSTQGVLYVDGIISKSGDVSYLTESATTSIQGVDTSVWRYTETTMLESGRYLGPGDSNAVVLGNSIANSVFKQPIEVNRQIAVEGKTFRVVGILQSTGAFGSQDSTVFMPVQTARQIFDLSGNTVSAISVEVSDSSQVQSIADQITSKLRIAHHVQADNQDFTVITSQAIESQINSILATFTLFLGAVAGISLLVGAIGISNTMFTSVMERTRLIGILKSIGATDGEILRIFVYESALIGLFGGILGVLFGLIGAGFIAELGASSQSSFTVAVPPDLIIFSVIFSVVIGAVAGFIPAKRASDLQPVEALRYE